MVPSRLGERFLLSVHDPFNGKPEVSHELIESGLVAADFAGLVIANRVGLTPEGLVPRTHGPQQQQPDEIGDYIVGHVIGEPTAQDLTTWIEVIGGAVFELHVRDLVDQAVIRRERHRSFARKARERLPAIDLLRAGGPLLNLRHVLRHPDELDLDSGVLACVVDAIGCRALLELDAHDDICENIRRELPQELQNLVTELGEAVTSIGFNRR